MEAIHAIAYFGPYANALMASEACVNGLTPDVLQKFVTEHYTASRMVLAASGVDHDTLLGYAKPILSDLPIVKRLSVPKPSYRGGDFRLPGESGTTHFALAFELPGGWLEEKGAIFLTVLQMHMGGGCLFSAFGPGKGMCSRLYLRVLNVFPQIQACTAFSCIFNESGLFGIQVTTGADFASSAVEIACNELIEVASPGVEKLQLDRAKQTTKSAILMTLESRMVASEEIGKQVLTYGKRKPVDYYLRAVDEVTAEDIAKVAQKLLQSPLTMASYGDVHHMPSYDSISCRGDRVIKSNNFPVSFMTLGNFTLLFNAFTILKSLQWRRGTSCRLLEQRSMRGATGWNSGATENRQHYQLWSGGPSKEPVSGTLPPDFPMVVKLLIANDEVDWDYILNHFLFNKEEH